MAAAQQNTDVHPVSPEQRNETRWGERIIEAVIRIGGISSIGIIALIFLFLLREGAPAFLDIPLRQLFGARWYPIEERFGMLPLLAGSLIVTAGAVAIAIPLGLTTAIGCSAWIDGLRRDWVLRMSPRTEAPAAPRVSCSM